MSWWVTAIKKYADFSGRARRTEFWMFTLFNIVFTVMTIIIDNAFGTTSEEYEPGLFSFFFSLAIVLPTWAVTVRRLHDTGKSGWWILINVIPFIGSLWLLIWMLVDSEPSNNQYGPYPKTNMAQVQS